MAKHREFMDLVLDAEGLHTPSGLLPLDAITRAEIVRNRVKDAGETTVTASPGAVVGGAVVGGVIAGPVGMVGGALVGSSVKSESTEPDVLRTVSADLLFESPEVSYSTTVGWERVADAESFVEAVRKAAGNL